MAKLDVLDNVRIASPCPVDWNEMQGDQHRRFCDQCERMVYDISEMGADEARAFLVEHEGSACITFFRRSDGRVMTRDCNVGACIRHEKRSHRVTRAGVLAGFVALGLAAWSIVVGITSSRPLPRTPVFRVGGFYLGTQGRSIGDYALPQVRPKKPTVVQKLYGPRLPANPNRRLPVKPR